MNELLQASLEGLHTNGGRHLELTQSDAAIQEYYQKRQQILQRQSDAIQVAIAQVQSEHQVELWQLEQEYAVYVSMITPAGEHT